MKRGADMTPPINPPFPPNLTEPKTHKFLRFLRYKDAHTSTNTFKKMKYGTPKLSFESAASPYEFFVKVKDSK